MSIISPSTLAAYQETDYCVFCEQPFILRIGSASKQLVWLYQQRNADCAAFVTACNPYSQEISKAANAAKQAELKRELEQRGLRFYEGEGRHPHGGWTAEPSFLVLGLNLDGAKELGRKYEQNAIVWCGADAVPELILLR